MPTHTRRITFSADTPGDGEAEIVLSGPAGLSTTVPDGAGEREAQLLVCGHFPDKNLRVTEQDLDAIVSRFAPDTVPIKVEHVDSALDPLGFVTRLWREGRALMARIAFDSDAAPLLAKRPVGRLSVGLDRDPATRALSLREVSLVLKPRLASAALLSDDTPAPAPMPGDDRDDRIAALSARLRAADVDARILGLKQAGKITPAIEPLARALLGQFSGAADDGPAITLHDGQAQSVHGAAWALLSALPPLVPFGETASARRPGLEFTGGPGGAAASGLQNGEEPEEELTPAQHAYARDVLQVDPAKVRAALHAHRRAQAQKSSSEKGGRL